MQLVLKVVNLINMTAQNNANANFVAIVPIDPCYLRVRECESMWAVG